MWDHYKPELTSMSGHCKHIQPLHPETQFQDTMILYGLLGSVLSHHKSAWPPRQY